MNVGTDVFYFFGAKYGEKNWKKKRDDF